jgi:DNA-binding CsgD family transcriptional regulator/PAS domain-containing protein
MSVNAEADIVDLVYEAAIDPTCWPAAMERYTDLVRGTVAALVVQDQITGTGRALAARQSSEHFSYYFGYFANRNPLLRITDTPVRLRVLTDEEKLPKADLVRTEYYNDYLRPHGMHSLLIARLSVEDTKTVTLNISRTAREEPFGSPEIETASRLQPHLVRAVRLATRLNGMERLEGGLKEIIDRSPHGAFLVDRRSKILYANCAGELLIANRNGLVLREGMLSASTDSASRKLHALIAAAAGKAGERSGGTLALPRADPRSPLLAIVSPVRTDRHGFFCDGQFVLVCITDRDASAKPSEHHLRDLFGLSRAESRIALQLLAGRSLHETARQMNVSYYTVRAHLAHVFDKTGTNRQAELVGLLARSTSQLGE